MQYGYQGPEGAFVLGPARVPTAVATTLINGDHPMRNLITADFAAFEDGISLRCGVGEGDVVSSPWRFLPGYLPQHFLYFLPLPQGQGSFRPGRP